MSNQNRVPAGVPTGGQWAEGRRAEASLPALNTSFLKERVATLMEHAFMGATMAMSKMGKARGNWSYGSTGALDSKGETLWERTRSLGEYDSQGGIPRMSRRPKDVRSLLRNYQGKGMSVTMPSVTSVRRMAKEVGPGRAFDIPVSFPGPDGTTTDGWVRVMKNKGRGGWSTRALGAPDEKTHAYMSEAVNSMLEARRITGNLNTKDVKTLIHERDDRNVRRQQSSKAAKKVTSGWIHSVRYDHGSRQIVMTTKTGKSYSTHGSLFEYERLAQAKAPGRVFNEMKKTHDIRQSIQCESCNQYFPVTSAHRCPAGTSAHGPSRERIEDAKYFINKTQGKSV